ncbi:pirin family protein [Robiginitomaculum antarcticum]|uniref:pirin family protein n=1 Tax=Robiginitomaculum antarcticum TaxID=437507 RepID=UPI0003746872|nr:pirin family protein [Robiginitomaculum antarcticum]
MTLLNKISPKAKDIGSFSVRRALPQIGLRAVGPWVFFDHFGPVQFKPGEGMDVRPHPHINLATVTYLFEGEIFHRDSLGNAQAIRPGAINLMVAGRGIAHSERTRDALRETGFKLHGLQLWHALPEDAEETAPEFLHYADADLPQTQINGVSVRVMMGSGWELTSPVKSFSPIFYAEVDMPAGTQLALPDGVEELAVYPVSGAVIYGDEKIETLEFGVLDVKAEHNIVAMSDNRVAIIGGTPLGKRHLWWNFVSSRPARIEQAKNDWKNGRFGDVPGDDEFIPLPE